MFQILAEAKNLEKMGKDVIHFEIGDPDFDTPPNVKSAAYRAIEENHTHYTISQGLEEFREQAIKTTYLSRKFKPSIEQILVTPGANIQIYLTILALANPGDDIIITDPSFVSYASIIALCNMNAIKVPLMEENNFSIDPDDIEKAISKKTKLMILNSPNNPTGSIISENSYRRIYEIAEKNNIFILSDEVYGRMIYDKKDFFSPSSIDHCNERVIVAHSFSKSFAMTGWRIGGLTGPKNLIDKMTLILETITSCVSPFIQLAALEAMKGSQDYVEKMILTFKKRRDILVDGLNSIDGISCLLPPGSFYAFPNIAKTKMSSIEFSNYLLENAFIATCPGIYFGEYGKNNVRFCFATDESKIIQALDRMKKIFLK